MKRRVLMFCCIATLIALLSFGSAQAAEYQVAGKPFTLLGYITQGAAYGLHNDYDTQHGLQAALTNFFVEAQYRPTQNLQLYTSLRYTADWAYEVNRHDTAWYDKSFYASRPRMYLDDNYWQILNEAHVTWKPSNFLLRVGKQLVVWGEMDGFRIMDQINPLDTRRGFADVEFENTLIPIWLIRTEYAPKLQTTWLQDLNLEFVFNPNADFITDQNPLVGNDDGGIWAPSVRIPDPTVPRGVDRFGSFYYNMSRPSRWSTNGFEYAFRIKGVVKDTILTLNYFYGVENSPVLKFHDPAVPLAVNFTRDGSPLLHFLLDGDYRRLHFVGMTASRDIPFLKASALGGVAPVFRFETFYAFNTSFETNFTNNPAIDEFNKSNEIRAGLGMDWKIKIPSLNPRAYFTISPQVYYRTLLNLPAGQEWIDSAQTYLRKDNVQTSLFLSTTYFNAKLVPSVFWLHDHVFDSNFWRFQVSYDWSTSFRFTLGAIFLDGNKPNYGLEPFADKDYVFGKVQWKFQ
jgi:hypothetical protein